MSFLNYILDEFSENVYDNNKITKKNDPITSIYWST